MISIIERAMAEHQRKAWNSLARYKFYMFGYHAAAWVTLKNLSPTGVQNPPNPFSELVKMAQRMFETAGVPIEDGIAQASHVSQTIRDATEEHLHPSDLSGQLAHSLRKFVMPDGHSQHCPNEGTRRDFGMDHGCEMKCVDLRAALAVYDGEAY